MKAMVRTIQCPHGRTMFSDRTEDGVRRIHGGIPSCCFDMLCSPAASDSFVILQRDGQQKRIHNGLMGTSLVSANAPAEGSGAPATDTIRRDVRQEVDRG